MVTLNRMSGNLTKSKSYFRSLSLSTEELVLLEMLVDLFFIKFFTQKIVGGLVRRVTIYFK